MEWRRPKRVDVGQRLLIRRRDLIGTVTKVEGDRAWLKLEWPWDPNAEPEEAAITELWGVPE